MKRELGGVMVLKRRESGVTLVIALLLSVLLMYVSIRATRFIMEATRSTNDMVNSFQAEQFGKIALYGARKAVENAELGENIVADLSGDDFGGFAERWKGTEFEKIIADAKASYEVIGQGGYLFNEGKLHGDIHGVNGGDVYVLPAAWTGDVPYSGLRSNPYGGGCDPRKPPIYKDKDNQDGVRVWKRVKQSDGSMQNLTVHELDHPCNWGKIKFGETISLPMYTILQDENKQQLRDQVGKLLTVNYQSFKLRVRTPCERVDGKIPEVCGNSERMVLDCVNNVGGEFKCVNDGVPSLNDVKKGDVILNWRIVGEGGEVVPNVLYDGVGYDKEDTQLNEGKINMKNGGNGIILGWPDMPNDNVVLTEQASAKRDGKLIKIEDVLNSLSANLIEKPILKLSMIDKAMSCAQEYWHLCPPNGQKVAPYLEYQLLITDVIDRPAPINDRRVIKVRGNFRGMIFEKVIRDLIAPKGTEFVIQN